MPTRHEMFVFPLAKTAVITIGADPTLISDLVDAASPGLVDGQNVMGFIITGKKGDGTDRAAIWSGFAADAMNLYFGIGENDDTPVSGDRYTQRDGGSDVEAVVIIGIQ